MFGAPLGIEAMPLREMVVLLVHQVLVGFLHFYLWHGVWRQKHVIRMPQMTISDSVVQLSNWFSSLRRKSGLVCAHPFLILPLVTFGVMGHNSFQKILKPRHTELLGICIYSRESRWRPHAPQTCQEGRTPSPPTSAQAETPAVAQRVTEHTVSSSAGLHEAEGFPDACWLRPRLQTQSSEENRP